MIKRINEIKYVNHLAMPYDSKAPENEHTSKRNWDFSSKNLLLTIQCFLPQWTPSVTHLHLPEI